MTKVRITPGPLARVSNRTLTTPCPAPCTHPWPNSGCLRSSPTRQLKISLAGSGSAVSVDSMSWWSSAGNSDSCRTSLRPENPTPTSRIGPTSLGSSSRRRAIAVSVPASAVAYGNVVDRVSVDMSDFLSLTVTVRAPRPSRSRRRWACSAIDIDACRSWSRVVRSTSKVDSALICLASARSTTGRSSIPLASNRNAGPAAPPRMLAASASDSAASALTVSTPNRRNLSSATGPIPHSRRTGRPASSRCSSSRRITRTPSGLANPEAIFAICLPDPAPTEVTRPVCSRTRNRNRAQNRSTVSASAPANSAGSPKASSKESCSSTGTIARTVCITRLLAT